MSNVKEIESAIQTLGRTELQELVAWIEDYLEDQMDFTDEFKASIEQSILLLARKLAKGTFDLLHVAHDFETSRTREWREA